MAELWYGHFDSTPEDERLLLAEDWARYIRGFVTDGIRNGGSCLQVTADSGMKLNLDSGVATVQGYMMEIKEDFAGRYYHQELEPAHPSLPRIDRVVIRLDRTIAARTVTPAVITGTAGSNPVAPALTRNANIYELSLAQVRVNGGAVNITGANITDERMNTEYCGLMNSVLGLDPSVWQAQFDAFLASMTAQETLFLAGHEGRFNAQLSAQQTTFNNQLSAQQTAQNAFAEQERIWFEGAQTDIARAAQFDFDNAASLPGNTKKTVFNADGSITETIKTTTGGKNVAIRNTLFNADGSINAEETVYKQDGTTVQRHTVTKTTFNGDGSISEGVTL